MRSGGLYNKHKGSSGDSDIARVDVEDESALSGTERGLKRAKECGSDYKRCVQSIVTNDAIDIPLTDRERSDLAAFLSSPITSAGGVAAVDRFGKLRVVDPAVKNEDASADEDALVEEDDRGKSAGDSEVDDLFTYLEYLLGHLTLSEFVSFLKPLCALSIRKTCDACMFAGGIHGYREV